MKIKVFPRKVIEIIIKESINIISNWALISISEPNEKLIDSDKEQKLKQLNCQKILSLEFSDLTLEEFNEIQKQEDTKFCKKEGLKLFSNEQSSLIINFLKQIKLDKDIKLLVIHCAAGISRSGAVGLWACRFLNLNESTFYSENPQIHPNKYVLSKLSLMSGITKDYEDFWKNLKISHEFDDMFIN